MPLVVSGTHLISTTEVTLLGVPAVFTATATTLTIDGDPVPPGFGDVVVTNPFGTASLPVAAWPTLISQTTGPGGTLDAVLDNGDVGLYVLALATGSLPAPIPIASPPTWYGILLDPTGPLFVLSTGAFATSDPVPLSFPVPPNPTLAGLGLYLQAWCQQGFFGPEVTYSFTNMGTVTL